MTQGNGSVVVVVVGADAAGLGSLAAALRADHGLPVAVFVADPADASVASDVAALAAELAPARSAGS